MANKIPEIKKRVRWDNCSNSDEENIVFCEDEEVKLRPENDDIPDAEPGVKPDAEPDSEPASDSELDSDPDSEPDEKSYSKVKNDDLNIEEEGTKEEKSEDSEWENDEGECSRNEACPSKALTIKRRGYKKSIGTSGNDWSESDEEIETSDNIHVKIRTIFPDALVPCRATDGAAGYDVYTCSRKTLQPGEQAKISLGFQMKLPKNVCAKLHSRSGLAAIFGVEVCGGVAIIDPDFYGPISVCMVNRGTRPYHLELHSRPAQITFEKFLKAKFSAGNCDEFSQKRTKRSKMGYGSTGGF